MKFRLFQITSLLFIAAFLISSCSGTATTSKPTTPVSTVAPTAAPAPTQTPMPVAVPVGEVTGLPQGSDGLGWWANSTFYEIFVRSFFDSNGDGIGDLKGITQKLDYLNDGNPATHTDLGVTGIWLMPIYPSPSYHGYDVTDYYNVNPQYGTLDDLKQLLAEAHKRGIRVILDITPNHTSSEHPWFKQAQDPKSPYHDWYIWSEQDPGYLGPWSEQVWHKNPSGSGYYYGVFVDTMPDLNYKTPAVMDEMKKIFQFWLKDVGVDGFRIDAARYIVEEGKNQADTPSTHNWFKQMRAFVKGISPEAIMVGEVWTTDFAVSTYVKGDELDMAFDFDLASAMLNSANAGTSDKVMGQLTFSGNTIPLGAGAPFLANHDMDRSISQLGGDLDKAKNAAVMLLTQPGTPFIYYGEEIGMSGQRGSENSDVKRRLPMQWTGEDPNGGFTTGMPWAPLYPFHGQFNVAVENGQPDSLLSFFRNLILIRSQHSALRTGQLFKVASSQNSVYATIRANKDEQVLVIVNLGKQPLTDLSLTLDTGTLSGSYLPLPILGERKFPELKANPKGGFDAYQLPSLPANARLILQLHSLGK